MQFFIRVTICVFLAGWWSTPVFSQTIVSMDSNIMKSAIDMTNINTESQTTNLIIDGYVEDDFDETFLKNTDATFSAKTESIKQDFEKIKKQDLSNISKASLDALKSTWTLNKSEIEEGGSLVSTLFVQTTTALDVLRIQRVRWSATLTVLNSSEAPIEMVNNIENIIARIDETETHLNGNLSILILLETKVNDLNAVVVIVEESIQNALEERSRDVFKQNAPVIWKLFFMESDSVVKDSTVTATIEADSLSSVSNKLVHWSNEKIKFSLAFIESNQNTIYIHIILWMLTVLLSLRFGRSEFEFKDTYNLTFAEQSLMDVRHKLILSATYISILYSMFLYDFLPFLILEVLVILLLFMNVMIHRKPKGNGVVNITLFLALLFITGQLSAETWFVGFGFRIYLCVKVGLVYGVFKLFKKYLDVYKDDKSPTIWKKLPKLNGFINVILVISVIANVLGFVKLADLSLLLATQILVVSFIFYGILVTSNGLVSLVFNVAWVPQKPNSLKFRNTIESAVLKVVNFFASLFWVKAILSTVGIYDPLMTAVLDTFNTPAEIGTISISLKDIALGLFVFILTYAMTKFIGILIKEGGLDKFQLKRGVPNAISLVVRYAVFGFGFMLALSVAGIDLSSFSLLAGALGIGIGFGLQNIISNFVSGLILVFERPLQEGDVVEVNNLLGIVKNIGIRSSNIRTYTGSEVVVPNEALISKELVNWTLSDPNKRIEINIGVDYGSEPRETIRLLVEAALGNSDVQRDPSPTAYFEEFGDSSLNFRLLFWVHHTIALSVRSDVMLRVSDTMRENDINIPFPIRTLMMDERSKKNLISPELLPDKRKNVDFDGRSKE